MASNEPGPCGLLGRFLAAHAPHMLSPGLAEAAELAATERPAERRSLLVRVFSPKADARATLRAELAAAVARHGAGTLSDALDRSTNPVAMAAAAELAEVENLEIGPGGTTRHGPRGAVGLRIVQAENDDTPAPALDVCRCPACEGRDDRGEGDA